MRTFLTVFAIVLMTGCTGDLIELNTSPDMAFSGAMEMGQGGGGELGPSTTHFSPDIQMDLDAKGCTLTACHGAMGTGALLFVKPNATAQADIDTNYMNVMGEINTTAPDQSPLLLNPLVGSGSGHQGTMPFANTQDATYQKWLAWIQAGAPKQ
jgi:hypothetical protein